MIMIIGIICFFYLMWDLINSWKLFSENPQPHSPPHEKNHSPFLLIPPKNSKSASPPFLSTFKIFQTPLQKVGEGGRGGRGKEDTMLTE